MELENAGHSTILRFVAPCLLLSCLVRSRLTNFRDEQLVRDIHVSIESLINSFILLVEKLPVWLDHNLVFVEIAETDAQARAFWEALGHEEPDLSTLVDVKLRWRHGRLEVDKRLESASDTHERVAGSIIYIWRFRKFVT